ncbi:hypothetical protein H310_06632 [Aphanomyces invadans]|uniref:Kinesin motor domain-containing protein n=1 Tax=Aphanomyces invadans TaxID=157072 RepID=A0A024U5X4_9STRA|nr:hypothetical protein H310_06632 [Aphanomyces invadans]ETW00993.1 hypothetical protein H310_06632 [Aphanomyces invadans]|eukprot:XP_008869991.1 hypothetical protein H310_06632 [Aphanomyces invadans]
MERIDDDYLCVKAHENHVTIASQTFAFDHVFGPDSQHEDIWPCVIPLIDSVFNGYNATIIAYGQAGTGKTFTMGCSHSSFVASPKERGILPRALHDVFSRIAAKALDVHGYHTKVTLRFFEIYRDEVWDLLSQAEAYNTTSHAFTLENAKHNRAHDACEIEVYSADECIALLDKGTYFRTTGLNNESSRSHAFFALTMHEYVPANSRHIKDKLEGSVVEYDVRSCTFSFVDLAGSQAHLQTYVHDYNFLDSAKDLSVLRNVINALADEAAQGRAHIPYHDSALTCALQDALGGNCMTLVIFCVSPAGKDIAETKRSLCLANRARHIRNKPLVNQAVNVFDGLRQQELGIGQVALGGRAEDANITLSEKMTVQCGGEDVDMIQGHIRAIEALHQAKHDRTNSRNRPLGTLSSAEGGMCSGDVGQEDWRIMDGEAADAKLDDELLMLMMAMEINVNTQPQLAPSWIAVSMDDSEDESLPNAVCQDMTHKRAAGQGHAMTVPSACSSDLLQPGCHQLNSTCATSLGRVCPTNNRRAAEHPVTLSGAWKQEELPEEQTTPQKQASNRIEREQALTLNEIVQTLTSPRTLNKRMLQKLHRNTKKCEDMRELFEAMARALDENERSLVEEQNNLLEKLDKMQCPANDPRHIQLLLKLQVKDGELTDLRKKQDDLKRFENVKRKSGILLAKYRLCCPTLPCLE